MGSTTSRFAWAIAIVLSSTLPSAVGSHEPPVEANEETCMEVVAQLVCVTAIARIDFLRCLPPDWDPTWVCGARFSVVTLGRTDTWLPGTAAGELKAVFTWCGPDGACVEEPILGAPLECEWESFGEQCSVGQEGDSASPRFFLGPGQCISAALAVTSRGTASVTSAQLLAQDAQADVSESDSICRRQ